MTEKNVSDQNRLVFNLYNDDRDNPHNIGKAKQIIQILEKIEHRSVVADIGCYTGLAGMKYARVPGVEKVEGFDIAEQALALAAKRLAATHVWSAGTEKCPAPSDSFDLVVASEVIEHVVDTDYFLEELKRILKPRGSAIITTPNLYYWLSRLKVLFGQAPWNYPSVSSSFKLDRNIITEHIRINGIKEWAGFFAARGFEVVESKGIHWVQPVSFKSSLIHMIDCLMPSSARCLALFWIRKKD